MSAGSSSILILDLAASRIDDQRRDARERAQAADVRRTRASRRLANRRR